MTHSTTAFTPLQQIVTTQQTGIAMIKTITTSNTELLSIDNENPPEPSLTSAFTFEMRSGISETVWLFACAKTATRHDENDSHKTTWPRSGIVRRQDNLSK